MEAANNGREITERRLFHGTSAESIDPICRNGFDWRLCGTHGTMYGQGSYFAKDASYSHRYTGLGRYGRFGSWSQHSSSSAMLRNRFNSRHQQLAKYIGQKIHSQLHHHHHQQGSLQQGNHGSQTPSQSFFNVMRLNRKGGLTLSAMVHPGVDPLAQQQHQQQQQGQLQTPGLQVVIPQAHTHSNNTPPWLRTSYFSGSGDTASGGSGASNSTASSSATTTPSSVAPQLNVVPPTAHSSSTAYTSLDQMGAQPPMAHMASTPQPAVNVRQPAVSTCPAIVQQTNSIAIPLSPTIRQAPSSASSSSSSAPTTGSASSASASTSGITSSSSSSSRGKVFPSVSSSSSSDSSSSSSSDDDNDDDFITNSNDGNSANSTISSSSSTLKQQRLMDAARFCKKLKQSTNRLKRRFNKLKKAASAANDASSAASVNTTTTKPIVIAPLDTSQPPPNVTAPGGPGQQVASVSATHASPTLLVLGTRGINVVHNSFGNPQCKGPQCPPPLPAHNSQQQHNNNNNGNNSNNSVNSNIMNNNNNSNQNVIFGSGPPPAHMNMPTLMNPLTLAPPPIQPHHHGALFLNNVPSFSSSSATRSNSAMDTNGGGGGEKIHTMFVSRVLVGCYAAGNASLRKPPPLDPSQPFGKAYDSCVDNVYDPKVFVVFDSSQCYPEYIIEYTNNTSCMDI